jgi:hypothetical protein
MIQELNATELISIYGGGVMKNLGNWCHRAWNSFCKNLDRALDEAVEMTAKSTTD